MRGIVAAHHIQSSQYITIQFEKLPVYGGYYQMHVDQYRLFVIFQTRLTK